MITTLYRAAALWTGLGLVGGLYYREFSRTHEVLDRSTQLGLVHTHTLMLGTVVFLVALALVKAFDVADSRRLTQWFWTWTAGLAISTGAMTVKGTLQILGSDAATSKALAGIAGLGHITLTVAFVLFFLALRPYVRPAAVAALTTPEPARTSR